MGWRMPRVQVLDVICWFDQDNGSMDQRARKNGGSGK